MMMLRLASLSLLLLFGCNESKVPMGPVESAPMDPALSGLWGPVTPADNGADFTQTNMKLGSGWKTLTIETDTEFESVLIVPFNEQEYYISLIGPTANPFEDILHMRGFLTPFEGTYFANLQMLTGDVELEDYMIFQFDLSEDGNFLTAKQIDHDMDHIETTEELHDFVRDILARDAFEDDDIYHFRKLDLD